MHLIVEKKTILLVLYEMMHVAITCALQNRSGMSVLFIATQIFEGLGIITLFEKLHACHKVFDSFLGNNKIAANPTDSK